MATQTISIKNVPKAVADRLKARAARHHRSLQGELMAILDESTRELTVDDLAQLAQRIGLQTPSESAAIVREDRRGRRR
ncbi:MAG: Arc family DNA-binding protein [Acidobacteria bacterium]|jgi:antitoxin FitA|nr:Arc family DNA-binding protein [Acidobacteriota bacterium]